MINRMINPIRGKKTAIGKSKYPENSIKLESWFRSVDITDINKNTDRKIAEKIIRNLMARLRISKEFITFYK